MSKKILFCLVIFCLLAISLTGCNNDSNKVSKEKIESELEFIDTKLVAILNSINGVSIGNYIVKSEEIKNKSGENNKDSKSSSTSGKESESTGSENSEKSSESSDSQSSNENSETKNIRYMMEGNEILLQDRTPDWKSAKTEIEKMYNTWATIELDLYKVNVNSQDILNFNSDLDNTTRFNKK